MIRAPHTIETAHGVSFDYYEPEVRTDDIAHALGNVCRFGGHTCRFYSVAEHSVLVAALVREWDSALALPALFHDGHEAYMGDAPSPLKPEFGDGFAELASLIDVAVADVLGIDPALFKHPAIKWADILAMHYEAAHLKPGEAWEYARRMSHEEAEAVHPGPLGWSPATARERFVEMYSEVI